MYIDVIRTPARQARLRDFLGDCLASTAGEEEVRLQEAAVLMGIPPEDHAVLQAMLACRAYESAALLVMGADRPFLLSQGGTGTCLASAVCADGSGDKTAEGATLALALLAAHVSALLADGDPSPVQPRRASSSPDARPH